MKKLDPSVGSSLLTLGVIVAIGLLLSVFTIVPSGSSASDLITTDPSGTGRGDDSGADPSGPIAGGPNAPGGPATGGPGGGGTGQAAVPTKPGQYCEPGRNGGNTDVGVTADSVKLAATIVADGPGSSFLGVVRTGMTTVLNRVNNVGGICGRKLSLTLRNDSWDAERGKTYIQNFVEGDKVFALAVVPSSEGLNNADEYIRQKGVPVVGTDGMLIKQYRNPWIWPVATSTISTMHVMAKDAADRGSKNFGIVFDAKYHFGVEGAYAFNQAVKRLTGADIPGYDKSLKQCHERFCGIQPQRPSYAPEARSFNEACYNHGTRCDFVAFLLEPDTAVSWFREGRPANPIVGFGGAQPLFTRDFAENCKGSCDGMWVWTGYNPPIEAIANQPGVAKFVNEVRAESGSADVTNQFLEGGYLGMTLLVEALKKVGPNLTRANLKAVLDSMTLDTGLSSPLSWRPGNHFANTTAQAFEIQYKQTFAGWRQKTGFIQDPWVGLDGDVGG